MEKRILNIKYEVKKMISKKYYHKFRIWIESNERNNNIKPFYKGNLKYYNIKFSNI